MTDCGAKWWYQQTEERRQRHNELTRLDYHLHKEKRKAQHKKWWSEQNGYWRNLRTRALFVLSRGAFPKCENCGCDEIKFLEINHLNRDGRKEREKRRVTSFYGDIVNGSRKVSDLDIRCRVCNVFYTLPDDLKKNYLITYKRGV